MTRGDRKTPGGNEFPADQPSWALTKKTRSWRVATGGVNGRFPPRPVTESATPIASTDNVYYGPAEAFTERDVTQAIRLTVRDALILQSFPADYPVQGSRTKQFEQVGNAVPPLLARHVLAQFAEGN